MFVCSAIKVKWDSTVGRHVVVEGDADDAEAMACNAMGMCARRTSWDLHIGHILLRSCPGHMHWAARGCNPVTQQC